MKDSPNPDLTTRRNLFQGAGSSILALAAVGAVTQRDSIPCLPISEVRPEKPAQPGQVLFENRTQTLLIANSQLEWVALGGSEKSEKPAPWSVAVKEQFELSPDKLIHLPLQDDRDHVEVSQSSNYLISLSAALELDQEQADSDWIKELSLYVQLDEETPRLIATAWGQPGRYGDPRIIPVQAFGQVPINLEAGSRLSFKLLFRTAKSSSARLRQQNTCFMGMPC